MNVAEFWIKKAMETTGSKSERQLAERIGALPGLMSDIKKGRTRMPPSMCQKIADVTGDDFGTILLSIMADKAKDESERQALFGMIERANPTGFQNLKGSVHCILCKIKDVGKAAKKITIPLPRIRLFQHRKHTHAGTSSGLEGMAV